VSHFADEFLRKYKKVTWICVCKAALFGKLNNWQLKRREVVTIHYCARQNFLDLWHKFKQYNDFYSEEIQVVVQKSLWVGHSYVFFKVVRVFFKDCISKSYCAFAGRVWSRTPRSPHST
jgi:hypothetical protein